MTKDIVEKVERGEALTAAEIDAERALIAQEVKRLQLCGALLWVAKNIPQAKSVTVTDHEVMIVNHHGHTEDVKCIGIGPYVRTALVQVVTEMSAAKAK